MKKLIAVAAIAMVGLVLPACTPPPEAPCHTSTTDPSDDILLTGPIDTDNNAEWHFNDLVGGEDCGGDMDTTFRMGSTAAACPNPGSAYLLSDGSFNTPAGYVWCF